MKLKNQMIQFASQSIIQDSYQSNFSLKYVIDGKESYLINGRNIDLTGGQALFVNNGARVEVTSQGHCTAVFLDEELLNEVLSAICKKVYQFPLFTSYGINMKPAFTSLLDSFLHNDHDIRLNEEFFYWLTEDFIWNQLKFLNYENIRTDKDPEFNLTKRIFKARDFIYDNIAEKITLDELARNCFVSKYHMLRSFKRIFGITPLKLHLILKVNMAKQLMDLENVSISQIATELNYPDLQSFSRQFKLYTGKTPSDYQNTDLIRTAPRLKYS